ncbi:MAG: DUF4236 domain-containing protein [Cucumibacter sp.]
MAIRFRRSLKIAPGLRLNIGKRSASVRLGPKNLGATFGTTGRTYSASIPGTGLGVTERQSRQTAGTRGAARAGFGTKFIFGVAGLVILGLVLAAIF